MNSKPRILIIENSIHITGALKSVTRTAFDLKEYFDFVFIIPKHSKGKFWIEKMGFDRIYELPMLEINRKILTMFFYFPVLVRNTWLLKKILKKEDIDLIHSNDLYNMLPVTLRWSGSELPYFCHVRFLPDKFPPFIFNTWLSLHLKYASSVVVVSHYLKRQLPTHAKIQVIHNELPVGLRYPEGLPKNQIPTILYLSNVIRGKGHQFAIEAFSKLNTKYPEWRLKFVGGDMGMKKNREYKEELKALAEKLQIAGQVQWVDFVQDVEKEYREAEMVLNFSESESFSLTCLEALYFGSALIATDCGGPAEIVDHNETGFLVNKTDVEAMAKYMEKLMVNEELRKAFEQEGMRRVREKFSIENTSIKLKEQYNLAIGNNDTV